MAFFNSKKTAAETPIPEVMEEHKQSIGNQVMHHAVRLCGDGHCEKSSGLVLRRFWR